MGGNNSTLNNGKYTKYDKSVSKQDDKPMYQFGNEYVSVETITEQNIGSKDVADKCANPGNDNYHCQNLKNNMYCMINQNLYPNDLMLRKLCSNPVGAGDWRSDDNRNIYYHTSQLFESKGVEKQTNVSYAVLKRFGQLNAMSLQELSQVSGIRVPASLLAITLPVTTSQNSRGVSSESIALSEATTASPLSHHNKSCTGTDTDTDTDTDSKSKHYRTIYNDYIQKHYK